MHAGEESGQVHGTIDRSLRVNSPNVIQYHCGSVSWRSHDGQILGTVAVRSSSGHWRVWLLKLAHQSVRVASTRKEMSGVESTIEAIAMHDKI